MVHHATCILLLFRPKQCSLELHCADMGTCFSSKFLCFPHQDPNLSSPPAERGKHGWEVQAQRRFLVHQPWDVGTQTLHPGEMRFLVNPSFSVRSSQHPHEAHTAYTRI